MNFVRFITANPYLRNELAELDCNDKDLIFVRTERRHKKVHGLRTTPAASSGQGYGDIDLRQRFENVATRESP